jgi:hypothetical protein
METSCCKENFAAAILKYPKVVATVPRKIITESPVPIANAHIDQA